MYTGVSLKLEYDIHMYAFIYVIYIINSVLPNESVQNESEEFSAHRSEAVGATLLLIYIFEV